MLLVLADEGTEFMVPPDGLAGNSWPDSREVRRLEWQESTAPSSCGGHAQLAADCWSDRTSALYHRGRARRCAEQDHKSKRRGKRNTPYPRASFGAEGKGLGIPFNYDGAAKRSATYPAMNITRINILRSASLRVC